MRSCFPAEDDKQEWVNVADGNGAAIRERIAHLVEMNVDADVLLVEVNRRLGNFLPKREALQFIYDNILKGKIRIANRDFTAFVVVESNGVAKGWRKSMTDVSLNTNDLTS